MTNEQTTYRIKRLQQQVNSICCKIKNVSIIYQANSNTFPQNLNIGSWLIVTDDGTESGNVLEMWIFNGTTWNEVPTSSFTLPQNVVDALLNSNSPSLTNPYATLLDIPIPNDIVVVINYSALPNPTTVATKFYWVSNSQGTQWLPGSLGGTYYPKGLYYSNGVSWEYMETPYQATQLEVNTGTNNDKFVTPNTLNNSIQWNTKQDTLISGTNIRTVNGNTLLGSTDLVVSASASGSTGEIQFNNGGAFGADSNLFWDNTNKRLGVGATPASTVRLDVRAQGALSTDIAFRVRNSGDTADIFTINGNGVFYKPHASPNNDTAQDVFVSQMSDGRNKIRLFTKGSFNVSSGIGVSFQSDAAGSNISSYTLSGAFLNSGGSYRDNGGLSEFNVGTSNVTGYSYLKLQNNTNTATNIYISRTGTIILNPDNANAQVRGLSIFGGTLGSTADRVISIGSGTAPTTSPADAFQLYSADRGGVAGKASAYFRAEDGTINVLGDLSGIGTSSPGARLDVRAQGALSTDIAFRVRNSADTKNIFAINGDDSINYLNGTSGGISITRSDTYNNTITNFNDIFGTNYISLNTGTNTIFCRGNIRIGRASGDGYFGMVTPTGEERYLRLVDVWGTQWLELGGDTYNSGAKLTMRAVTNNNTNYVRFRGYGNTNEVVISDNACIGIGGSTYGTSAKYVIAQFTGTAPATSPTDAYQQYSADITAGNAAPHFRTENGNIIKIYRETTAVVAGAFVSNTSLIVDDSATYGGYTMGQVVAALKAQGLLA